MEKLGVKKCSVLAVLLFTLLIPVVQATPSTTVNGYWTYTSNLQPVKLAGDNLFLSGTENRAWFGTFTGNSGPDVLSGVIHSNGKLNFEALINFYDCTVKRLDEPDRTGTLVIHITGRGTVPELYGQWVILSGTGGLANLRGQGTFSGEMGGSIQYSGQIHFEPD